MITYQRKAGTTDVSVVIRIIDSTDGTPETGVVYNTSGIALEYRREGATSTAITEATLAGLDSAHADGGFLHVGNGYYRLDLPDAACAAGATGVLVHGVVTGMVVIGCYVQLVTFDPFDTVRLGLTALPNAAADAAGGLPISDAGGLDIDAKLANTNEVTAARMATLTDWINGGRLDAILDLVATASALATVDTVVDGIATDVAAVHVHAQTIETDVAATHVHAAAADTQTVAAAIRTDLGLATANLDTQLAALSTDADVNAACDTAVSDAALATAANLADLHTDVGTAIADIAATHVHAAAADTQTTAAAIRADLGLASANLDTQLAALPTDADVNAQMDSALTDIHLDHLFATDYDPAAKPGTATALLNELVESDAGVSRFTVNALENGPSGTGASAATIADAVWDEVLDTDHEVAGSSSVLLQAAGAAADPWATAIPGAYGAGTAGKILGDNINAPIATIDTVVDGIATTLGAAGAGLTAVASATNLADLHTDVGTAITDIAATHVHAAAADSQTVAATVRTAVGLATANLDTQLAALPTDADVNAACDTAVSDAALATAANLALVKTDTAAILADTGTDGVVVVTASKTGYALSAAGVDAVLDEVVEGTTTVRQGLKGIMSALFAKLSGAATTTVTVRDIGDTKARITATVDENGNRTAVTTDLT